MASTINASTTSGIVQTADTSGVLQLQSNGTTIATISSTGLSTQVGAPAFSAYATSGTTLTTGVFTKIAFQAKEFDTSNCFDSTTNYRFTPNVAGYYQVNSTISLNNASGSLLVDLYKNGSEFKRGSAVSQVTGIGTYATGSWLVYMNGTTDYLEIYGYQATVASISTTATSISSYFQASMVRSA
jgi:hypothetical protein